MLWRKRDATVEQARRLFLRFFEDRELEADAFGTAAGDQGVSMAALQGHLLRYRNDPDGAVANALDLLSAPQPFALTASAG